MSGDHNDTARTLRSIVGEPDNPGNLRAEISAAGGAHSILPSSIKEGVTADIAIELEKQRRAVSHIIGNNQTVEGSTSLAASRGLAPFGRGMVCRHKKSGKQVTILQASVDTAPSGAPVHKIVFGDGTTKNVPEGNLERI